MRLAAFAILSVACSACGTGPKVTVCISDPVNSGFQCSPPEGEEFLLPYDKSENFVALSPKDTRTVLEYAKRKCKQ